MKTDQLGIPIYSKQDILDIIFQGKFDHLNKIVVDIEETELDKFNKVAPEMFNIRLTPYSTVDIPINEFDRSLQADWLMPEEYKNLDIAKWVLDQCQTQEALQRVGEELLEFQRRDMMDLLRWMKYFVDTCRANNVLWGVGRGSSVASYVLYKIGVHRINSLKYNLDWQEFLR